MNKNKTIGIILVLLIGAFFLNRYIQRKHESTSSLIFSGNTDQIQKVLIQKENDAIQLEFADSSWSIAGNDSLIVRENKITDLFEIVFATEKTTKVSENPDKWYKYSVDDSLGTHLDLISNDDQTLGYFVFGRSKTDWSHNYVRVRKSPEVYLTSSSIIHHLGTTESFWGKEPPAPEISDSLIFSGNTDQIQKVLIQKENDAIQLEFADSSWSIAGNDSLIVRENKITDLFEIVFATEKTTKVSENPDKWYKYSVDDSLGTHLDLISNDDQTLGYFVFGRSKTDWSHNYVRVRKSPEVYLTSSSIIHHLGTTESFWGKEPPAPEISDSLITNEN